MCCNNVLYSLLKYFFDNLYPFQRLIKSFKPVCAIHEEVAALKNQTSLYIANLPYIITYFNQYIAIHIT